MPDLSFSAAECGVDVVISKDEITSVDDHFCGCCDAVITSIVGTLSRKVLRLNNVAFTVHVTPLYARR